jgi:hypothetical protein
MFGNFYSEILLKTHLRRHSDNKNKRHICRWCGRAYAFASELAVHEKVHTERPYKCAECNASYASRKTLKQPCRQHPYGQATLRLQRMWRDV